jgi:antitoxin (DNA-binding transcriptional repressor) of toxin-antitoxin stability system
MATKVVGVRELKEQAPRLVKRAAEGERFIITRHGEAVATLAPLGPDEGAVWSPSRRAWEQERTAFEASESQLSKTHRGRFVAFCGGEPIDEDADHEILYHRVARQVGDRAFFIGRPGEAPPVVDMPGFEVG